MTQRELSALDDVQRTLENIKEYCVRRSLFYDKDRDKWKYLASEATYGLIKVSHVKRGG